MRSRGCLFAITAVLVASCAASTPAVETAPDLESLVGPGTRAPESEVERALLPQLADTPDGGVVNAGGEAIELGPMYSAASGRECRSVLRAQSDRPATACRVDGAWAFVPSVVAVERGPK